MYLQWEHGNIHLTDGLPILSPSMRRWPRCIDTYSPGLGVSIWLWTTDNLTSPASCGELEL